MWMGGDASHDVAIEVYFNPKHSYNVDRFIDAAKRALALGSLGYLLAEAGTASPT
jgi:hypothetical protein